MATILELARDAFSSCNYPLAVEFFERGLTEIRHPTSEIYFLYGESLCRVGRIKEALDVYSHICQQINYHLTIDQLKHLTYSLLENVVKTSRRFAACVKYDPLLCPICHEVIIQPVTAMCGHTFCRQCVTDRTQCIECGVKFTVGQNFEQDILVKKLVEKWWPNEIKSSELNEEAIGYLDTKSLDEALRCCNQSLEKAPNNFSGLLLRSEVLHRLNHFQSSLADADNALKCRPTSFKAHFRRAEALASLGRCDEAITAYCVSVCLDRSSQNIPKSVRHGITRILQRLLTPANSHLISSRLATPYNNLYTGRRRRLHHLHHASGNGTVGRHLISTSIRCNPAQVVVDGSDCDEDNSSCGEDETIFLSTGGRRQLRSNMGPQNTIPRQNNRLRMLVDRIFQEIEKIRRVEPAQIELQVNPTLVETSDFDCVLCSRTLWKPVVTPCGHTYCWICLDRSMYYSSQCPLCMSPLIEQFQRQTTNLTRISSPTRISLAKRSVTFFVEEAMRRFIPVIYSKRLTQELEEEPSIPIFICTTAFPSVPCPLYVFEPRYRLMVRRAIENGERSFGIVLAKGDGGNRYHDYGTMLDIRDCVMLSDGCSILSTIGKRRFKVLARGEKDGYDTAKIDYIHDEPIKEEQLTVVKEMNRKVLMKAIYWYQNLSDSQKLEIVKSFGRMPDLEPDWEKSMDGPAWVWWMTAILPLKKSLQAEMLATTSLEKRLKAIDKTLAYYQAEQQKCLPHMSCDGLPSCQAIDCCQRGTTSINFDVRSNPNQSTEFLL